MSPEDPMSPADIDEYLKRQPFMPFLIHMGNGRTLEVRHPEAAVLTMNAVHVGVHHEGDKWPRFIRTVALVNINELEPLAAH